MRYTSSKNKGSYLKQFRLHLGMTQSEIADILGVPLNTYSRWERNVLAIRHWQMLNLAIAHLSCIKHR